MIRFIMQTPQQKRHALIDSQLGKMSRLQQEVWCSIALKTPPGVISADITTKPPYNKSTIHCAKALARMGSQARYTLANLQQHHVSPHILLAIYHFMKTLILGAKNGHTAFNASVFGTQVIEKFSHYHHSTIHTLSHELAGAFQLLYQAGTAITIEARQAAISAYRDIHKALSEKFEFLLKRYVSEFYNTFHPSHRHHYRFKLKAWQLSNEQMTNNIRRALKYTHKIAEGLFVIDLSIAAYDSLNIIFNDPNWFPDLTHEILDVESFFTVSLLIDGIIAILAPSPAGWLVMLATGALTVLTHRLLMHKVLSPYLNYINRNYHARF